MHRLWCIFLKYILKHRAMKLYLQSLRVSSVGLFNKGGLAQLARALAWHARGRRFDPDTLHSIQIRVSAKC